MSEVKRYHVTEAGLVEGQALGRINVVLGPDYDSAVQCFLTAAEGCVAAERRERALQALLTAADERADQQSWALLEVEAACDLAMSAMDDDERGANFVKIVAAIKAKAVLKPAEGGGDEYRKSCEAAHKALSMENQRITPVEKKTDPRVIDALREAGYLRND